MHVVAYLRVKTNIATTDPPPVMLLNKPTSYQADKETPKYKFNHTKANGQHSSTATI